MGPSQVVVRRIIIPLAVQDLLEKEARVSFAVFITGIPASGTDTLNASTPNERMGVTALIKFNTQSDMKLPPYRIYNKTRNSTPPIRLQDEAFRNPVEQSVSKSIGRAWKINEILA